MAETSLLIRIGADISNLDKATKSAITKINNLANSAKTIGASLSAVFTVPTIGIGAGALKLAGDFEGSFNKIKANIDGITGPALEKLRGQALQLGADTAFSAQQAADGMAVFGSAGFKATQVMEAMAGTLNLAAAGSMAVADAAALTKDILGQFALQATKSGHVADVLAQASKDTSASLSEMGTTLTYVGPAAKGAGQSLEETVASIIALDAAGIRGEKAGTGLRGVLASLLAPSKEAKEAMDSLGIRISNSVGKILPLSNIMEQFRTKLSGIGSEAEKQRVFFDVFGREAGNTAQILATAGAASLDGYREKLEKSAGAADALAKTLNSGLNYSLDQMKGSLETAGIAIGEALIPTARRALAVITELTNDALIPALEAFKGMPDVVQGTAIGLVGVTAAAGPALFTLGQLATSITSVTVAYRTFATTATGGALIAAVTAAASALSGLLVPALIAVTSYKLSEWLYDNSTRFKDFIDWTAQANKAMGDLYVTMTASKPTSEFFADAWRVSIALLKEQLDRTVSSMRGFWDVVLNDRGKQATENISTFAGAIGRMSAAAAASQSLQNGAAKAAMSFSEAVADAVKSIQDGEMRTAAYNEALKRLHKTHGELKKEVKEVFQYTADGLLDSITAFEKTKTASDKFRDQIKLANEQAKEFQEKGYITLASDQAIESLLKLGAQTKQTTADLLTLNTAIATPPPPPRKVPGAMPIPEEMKRTGKAINETATIAERFSRQVSSVMTDMSRDISSNIVHWKGLTAAITSTLQNVGQAILRAAIEGQLRRISTLITGMITDGGKLGKVLGAVFNLPSGAKTAATDAPSVIKNAVDGAGAAAAPASGAAGAVGSVAGAGATAIVGAVAGVVSAVSGVIGNFQMHGMNKSLDLIVNHTLRTANQLIYGLQPQVNAYLPFLQSIHERLQTVVDRGINITGMNGVATPSVSSGGTTVINNFYGITDVNKMLELQTRSLKLRGAIR